MVTDRNVVIFIDLMITYTITQIQRLFWIIRFHPRNPIPRWTMDMRINRMIKELEKDLSKD
jgi:hypothetical protein